MIMNVDRDRRSLLIAATIAVVMTATAGVGYRVVAGHLARPTDSIPLSSEDLAKLPMQIEQWRGREVKLDEAVIRATDTDAHVSRAYRRGGESISLFIAYGVRARDLMPHRPEVCYPGSGWTSAGSDLVQLPLANGTELPCRVYRFNRSGFAQRSVTVLNYYIVDGEYSPDVSLLRSKAWRGSGGVRYIAQVQISCSSGQGFSGAATDRSVRQFAAESALEIRALLPDASPGSISVDQATSREREGAGS